MNFKKGFTLAEVLITLGIIGIVAALTLPSLIQKHQKQVWVNQLKKSVSTWENGFKMMLADAETDDLQNTEFWQKLDEDIGYAYSCNSAFDGKLVANDEILKKYFNILLFGANDIDSACMESAKDGEDYAYKSLGSDEPVIMVQVSRRIEMADGTTVGLVLLAENSEINISLPGCIGTVLIDVNGRDKRPNRFGRDVFYFGVNKKGVLVPIASYEELKANPAFCGNLETGDISGAVGFCEARITHDGWQMNY